ncbi:MAG: GNAT family N-acetyltransferase [Oscillospiraceae bacterium]|nr:GNAT family N-acetyltransferase [Oscillospiraceae bacterium]
MKANEISIRCPNIEEERQLRHIWRCVFGKGEESAFFGFYYDPELCIAAIEDGVPVAAGYLLPTGDAVYGATSLPCAMIYGVATLPGHRCQGLGAAVVRVLLRLGNDLGFPTIALCPSEDSLFGFYSARSELREWFYIDEQKLVISTSVDASCKGRDRVGDRNRDSGARIMPREVSHSDYGRLRESLLIGIPHIRADERALSYQELLCHESNGALVQIDTPGGVSCAIVEPRQEEPLLIKELLAPDGFEPDAISSIMLASHANECVVRVPARSQNQHTQSANNAIVSSDPAPTEHCRDAVLCRFPNGGADTTVRRFGMISAPDYLYVATVGQSVMPWFGLAFD